MSSLSTPTFTRGSNTSLVTLLWLLQSVLLDATCLNTAACSNRGLCVRGTCFCRSPWGDAACSTNLLSDTQEAAPSPPLTSLILDRSASSQGVLRSATHLKFKVKVRQPEQNVRLQKEVNELNSEMHSVMANMVAHKNIEDSAKHLLDGDIEASAKHLLGIDEAEKEKGKGKGKGKEKAEGKAGEDAEKHSPPPSHVKREMDWKVAHSRAAIVTSVMILITVVLVLAIIYISETTRDVVHSMLGNRHIMNPLVDRPEPNLYRAIAVFMPEDIGWKKWFTYSCQGVVCVIMQLYIPLTLLYQNMVEFEVVGVKQYDSISWAWWYANMMRTLGLFNLAALFCSATVHEIVEEADNDFCLLRSRHVRFEDKDRSDVLIKFCNDLDDEKPAKRLAAADMLRKNVDPQSYMLMPSKSDPEKGGVETDPIERLIDQLGMITWEDEEGADTPELAEADEDVRKAVIQALGVLANPDHERGKNALEAHKEHETVEEVRLEVDKALLAIQTAGVKPPAFQRSPARSAWQHMWVSISLLITIVVATFLEVVVFLKIMVLTASVEEVTLIIMAMFFVNDLDEKVMKGQPHLRKLYWANCYEQSHFRKHKPNWILHLVKGAVPIIKIIQYLGLIGMVSIAWKDRYTGEMVD